MADTPLPFAALGNQPDDLIQNDVDNDAHILHLAGWVDIPEASRRLRLGNMPQFRAVSVEHRLVQFNEHAPGCAAVQREPGIGYQECPGCEDQRRVHGLVGWFMRPARRGTPHAVEVTRVRFALR